MAGPWHIFTVEHGSEDVARYPGLHGLPSVVDRLCIQNEGWGPLSPTRYDLTPCFEYSVLFGIVSWMAILGFTARIYYLTHHAEAHNLGRAAWIYWSTQACMSLGAVVAWALSWSLFSLPDESPIYAWSCLSLGTAWALAVVLNRYEHEYEIRSSSAIFAFYASSITSSLIIIKTTMELNSTQHPTFALLAAQIVILSTGFIIEGWPRGNTRVQKLSGVGLYGKANLLSRLTFFFYLPIIKIGLRRTLTPDDILGQLPKSMATPAVYKKLNGAWTARLKKRERSWKSRPSLFGTIFLANWRQLVPVLLSRIAIVLFSYTLPVLLKGLLNYLEDYESKPLSYGIMLAVGMFLSSLFASLLYTYNRYQMILIGVSTRTAIIAMIYRKALRLSPKARGQSTTGQITNLMSVDADQWWDAVVGLSVWLSIPIELTIAMKLLYGLLGWTMLAGVLAMLAILPFQAWQGRVFERIQKEKLKAMDERVRLTTDTLASMKIIKLYGWGTAFFNRILAVREQELQALRRIGIVQSFMSIIFISSSLIISLITFGIFSLWGGPDFTPGKLTPQTVFVSMTLFGMLRGPIASLADATTVTISVLVATKRIETFLLNEEVSETDILRFDSLPRDPNDPVISIKEATFSWDEPSDDTLDKPLVDETTALLPDRIHEQSHQAAPPTLQDINLEVGRGTLTAIVGRVGQGKSSLLSALISDMYKLHGKVQISGRIAYVPQQAWILNKSLKDNIVFDNEYDEARYQRVLFACGLEPDIAILPAGDATEIGERGINLSGGQKQRVSLARAAYDDADIYLLDDPLSAVDAHVDRHLWENLIGPSGLLRSKTRVLVTHGIHHLRHVDQIVVLKDGAIEEKGGYRELMASKQAFYRLIKEYSILERRRSHEVERRGSNDIKNNSVIASASSECEERPDIIGESGESGLEEDTGEEIESDNNTEETVGQQALNDPKKDVRWQLIAAEAMKEGEVGFDVVISYTKAASTKLCIIIFVMFILAQGCLVSTSLWLKYWILKTKDTDDDRPPSPVLFLAVYSILTFIYVLLYVIIMFLGLAVARIRAAERIHAKLLNMIFRLPIAFFDTTPLGRIINRFSSDISMVDVKIPNKMMDVLLFGISVLSTVLLIVFTTPSFIVALPFLILAYWGMLVCFLSVSRTLARIYSVSKSPIYQQFNETLGGVSIIRAMRYDDRFIQRNAFMTDRATNNFLSNMSSRRWLDVQLRMCSLAILLCASLLAVLGRKTLDASMVGLMLSFALTLTEEMTTLVRIFCDLQNVFVAMERVLEYTELNPEAPEKTDVILPPNWPSQGRISFINYSTRYREGLNLVIKNVSLDIAPAEKVGIVGRTGAGKSSLTLALFRIIEAANSYWAKQSDNSRVSEVDVAPGSSPGSYCSGINEEEEEREDGGKIEIDGVDIATIGLQDLRQHLAIIPQDPTLFTGSVRENLDPFQELEDADLWEALERSHLKDHISALPGGLSYEVSQNGENFSVGQRSLICLARALLRKSKILVMDEATAAVDVETDKLIQKTIRKEFKDRTVLTIAHRIKTVMDSDKILVLEYGRVREFDAPKNLLKDESSLFYKLAEQAGEV